jgi:hypothetical protein
LVTAVEELLVERSLPSNGTTCQTIVLNMSEIVLYLYERCLLPIRAAIRHGALSAVKDAILLYLKIIRSYLKVRQVFPKIMYLLFKHFARTIMVIQLYL